MNISRRTVLTAALAAGSGVLLATPAHAQNWAFTTSDQWGLWNTGGYTIYNNIWGGGAGTQTLRANSPSHWQVRADHPNTGGIKSYPNASRYLGRRVSGIGRVSSRFAVTVPTRDVAFTSAYDIWTEGHRHEIMLWMNRYGPVGPLGTFETRTQVGGHSWDVHRGSNGHNEVYSFIRTTNTLSGTVDIAAVASWIRARGWFGDELIGDVQFGYEITSAAGGKTFTTDSYAVDVG